MTDAELLQQHCQGSKDAFAEIVRRHIDWVWGVARRRVRDSHLAEDVTQLSFMTLSRKPPRLEANQSLIPWLFGVVNLTARQAMRSESRRQRRETEAAKMQSLIQTSQDDRWESELDELVGRLRHADRQALLLRYYGQKSFAEVGAAMRISEAAAQKRVSRATEKLRNMLADRGITMPATALSGLLLTELAKPAPSALAATIAAAPVAATASGTAVVLTKGVILMTAWTKLKLAAGIALAIFLTIGTGIVALRPRSEPVTTVRGWTVRSILDALDARATQLVRGNLTFTAISHENGQARQIAEYFFLLDGQRFAATRPEDGARIAFDGTNYKVRGDKQAEFVIRDGVRRDFMHGEVDPRFVNHLEPSIARYFRNHLSRVGIERSPESADVMILSIEVPKEELYEALIMWPESCREGAAIRIWMQVPEAMPLKMELRGTTGKDKDILGRRVTWSDWLKRDAGVWIPTSIRRQVFVTRSGAYTLASDLEFRFDQVDLTYQPTDAEFELTPPAGYKVHDERTGKRSIYIANETSTFPAEELRR